MTLERQELQQRIEEFDIDGCEAALPFAARLAREHGWSRPHADRVMREYKRYVILAMVSDTPVCPSEDVDAAWHLHLTYTRSYWKRFCGEVLGRPLHHDPTRGGPAEADKHLRMYDATLAAYRGTFGEAPPADIWPPANQRFGEDLRQRVVNTARNWVIPKLPVKRVLQVAAAFLVAAALLPGCQGGMNPFDLKGTDFLYFLIPMMIAAICIGRVVRNIMRSPGPQAGDDDLELTWEQAAYLAGGPARLTTAAIARLAEAGVIKVEDNLLEAHPAHPTYEPSPVEQAVLANLPIRKTDLKAVQQAVEDRFSNKAERLQEDGLALSRNQQVTVALGGFLPFALVMLGLAVPRLVMGLSAGKPVGYLVATLIIGGIVGMIACFAGNSRATRRGENLLVYLRAENARLKTGSGSDAALAVALFGTAALAGSSVAYLQTWYPRQTSSDSGCGSGCGGGGDGGGGGGCGGCGGGGD